MDDESDVLAELQTARARVRDEIREIDQRAIDRTKEADEDSAKRAKLVEALGENVEPVKPKRKYVRKAKPATAQEPAPAGAEVPT